MKRDDPASTMAKTQAYMFSTLSPLTTASRRYNDRTRTSKRGHSVLGRPSDPEQAQAAVSAAREMRSLVRTPNLPELKKDKNIMLQEWVNQALQGEGEVGVRESLRTLKRYGLDKHSLRNMGLSHEAIQRMYKGLFVYTSGIKNAFQEMLAEAQAMPENTKLSVLYFKVFIKLFQNIAPMKSCFELIEEDHIRNLADFKRTNGELLKQKEREKQEIEASEKRVKKQLQQFMTKYKTAMYDYKIMQSNLILYEQSFNDQVLLRLKFEQKINQTYSSYEELKGKYECMRQQLVYKNQLLNMSDIDQHGSQQKFIDLELQNAYLLSQMGQLQEKIKAREQEMSIKNQQILDIRLDNHNAQQKKMTEENIYDDLKLKLSLLKKQKKELQDKCQSLNRDIIKHLSLIQKLKADLSYARQKNDQIYIKYHEATLKMVPVQKEVHEKSLKISSLTKQNSALKMTNSLLEEQRRQDKKTISQFQMQLQINNKNLFNSSKQIQKISKTIIDLKDVKDRYERINIKLDEQLKLARLQIQTRVKEITQANSKNAECQAKIAKLLSQQKSSQIYLIRLEMAMKQKQQAAVARQQQNIKKTNSVQNKLIQRQIQMDQMKEEYRKLFNDLGRKENQKLKTLEEISYLSRSNQSNQLQIKQKKVQLSQLVIQNQKKKEQIQQLKKQLSNRKYTLQKKKDDVNGQIINLKIAISNLKQKMKSRTQYIHPMIAEDMAEQINRLCSKIHKIYEDNKEMRNTYQALRAELMMKKQQVNSGVGEMGKLNKNIEFYSKQLLKEKQEGKLKRQAFEKKLAQKDVQMKNVKLKLQGQINQIQVQVQKKNKQIKDKEKTIGNLQRQLQDMRKDIKKLNQKPQVIDEQLQTEEIPIVNKQNQLQFIETGCQTQPSSVSNNPNNGRKLTTTDRLRQKKQEADLSQPVGLGKTINGTVLASPLNQISQQREVKPQQKDTKAVQLPRRHLNERRVDVKDYKEALKLTYMRR